MITHDVRAHRSKDNLKREDQLAWKIAEVAADPVAVEDDVTDMIINRIIDNASVGIASLNRSPIKSARAMANAHLRERRRDTVWSACGASGLRRMGRLGERHGGARARFHDTFLAAEYSHPGDNIPPILAVAQQMGCDGTRSCAALRRAMKFRSIS